MSFRITIPSKRLFLYDLTNSLLLQSKGYNKTRCHVMSNEATTSNGYYALTTPAKSCISSQVTEHAPSCHVTRPLSFVITSVYKSDKQIQDVFIIGAS